ncbi:MAG: Tat-linked quality control protein TatD [Anaerolineae bacterium]|nr:Tat-linked quality control protein TatD [Anaerolineae bacterium]
MGRHGKHIMHDAHCHLDLYSDPYQVASATENANITTIAVTNLPSAYLAAKPHMRRFRSLKLAVGLHPLLAHEHSSQQKQLFQDSIRETRFVGEVGLDFSKQGIETKDKQLESFRFILRLLQNTRRFVTLHSRRAESSVFELLNEYQVGPVVFHWYSGSLKTLERIAEAGHYFSINTSMIKSKNGQQIIKCIPKDQILTETDGPFIKIDNRSVVPADVQHIQDYLSDLWGCNLTTVQIQLENNFVQCLKLAT